MVSLTPRQREILRFIASSIEANGFAPTMEEIARGTGLANRGSAHRLMSGLEERGAIRTRPATARAIEILVPVPLPRAPDGAPLRVVSAAEMKRGAQ